MVISDFFDILTGNKLPAVRLNQTLSICTVMWGDSCLAILSQSSC